MVKLLFNVSKLIVAPIVALIFVVVVIGNGDDGSWATSRYILSVVGRVPFDQLNDGASTFYVLLFATSALTAVNSVFFSVEITGLLQASSMPEGRWRRRFAVHAIQILTVINILWPVSILLGLTDRFYHELIVLGLFSGFAYLDYLLLSSYRNELKIDRDMGAGVFDCLMGRDFSPTANDIKRYKARFSSIDNISEYVSTRRGHNYYKNQLYFVDLPVIFSVSLLILFSLFLEGRHEFSQSFLTGITAGGLVMHLAMSQIIFMIASMQNEIREARCHRGLKALREHF
jgi:hypothetical protein